jgi:hypothetical protein
MTKRWLCCAWLSIAWLAIATAAAHPGSGIAVDEAGRVYYTDLTQILRIDGAARTVVVSDVHTHAMTRAADGVIRGEDSRYLGDDRYEHRTWALHADGTVEYTPWQAGFWPTSGIHRDARGNLSRATCPEQRCAIWRAAPDGAEQRIHDAPDGARIGAMHVTAAGVVVFVENDAIRRIDVDRAASELAPADRAQRFGLWADDCGNLLTTSYAARDVAHRSPAGAWSSVHASAADWGPSGVAVSASGDVWVLEYSTRNEARVVRARQAPAIRSTCTGRAASAPQH